MTGETTSTGWNSETVQLWVTEPAYRNPLVYVSLICRGSTVVMTSIGLTKKAAERRAFLKAHRQARNVGYSPRAYSTHKAWWKERK